MNIKDGWLAIQRRGELCQVFAGKRQEPSREHERISVFTLRDMIAAERREAEHFDRLIGYYTPGCSFESFEADCLAVCEEVSKANAYFAGVFRLPGQRPKRDGAFSRQLTKSRLG